MKQQQELITKHPDGVKIIINNEDPMDIQSDINGPQATPYEIGIFRIKLIIPVDFPHIPPKGKKYFDFRLFYNKNISSKRFT